MQERFCCFIEDFDGLFANEVVALTKEEIVLVAGGISYSLAISAYNIPSLHRFQSSLNRLVCTKMVIINSRY
jgi:hypothetical protein